MKKKKHKYYLTLSCGLLFLIIVLVISCASPEKKAPVKQVPIGSVTKNSDKVSTTPAQEQNSDQESNRTSSRPPVR